jgi:hypothetical protein
MYNCYGGYMKNTIKSLSIFLFSVGYPLIMYNLIIYIPKIVLKYIPVIAWILILDLILVFILYWFYRKDLKEEWIIFKNNWKKILEDNLPYWILGLLIMSILSIVIEIIISKEMPENEKIVRDLLKSFPLYMIFSSVIVAPFTEEIVYRKIFKDVIKNRYIYMTFCGLLFGLAHVIFSYESAADFLYVFPYGALGTVFAYMYDKTKTIFTPMIFHLSHNLLMILITVITSLAVS